MPDRRMRFSTQALAVAGQRRSTTLGIVESSNEFGATLDPIRPPAAALCGARWRGADGRSLLVRSLVRRTSVERVERTEEIPLDVLESAKGSGGSGNPWSMAAHRRALCGILRVRAGEKVDGSDKATRGVVRLLEEESNRLRRAALCPKMLGGGR
jgi:hypothetical protein